MHLNDLLTSSTGAEVAEKLGQMAFTGTLELIVFLGENSRAMAYP